MPPPLQKHSAFSVIWLSLNSIRSTTTINETRTKCKERLHGYPLEIVQQLVSLHQGLVILLMLRSPADNLIEVQTARDRSALLHGVVAIETGDRSFGSPE